MKKLLAIMLGIVASQGLYAEYVYDSDIATDTGEIIKTYQHSKRFDGQCVEMREGIVESLENKDYNKVYKGYKEKTLNDMRQVEP